MNWEETWKLKSIEGRGHVPTWNWQGEHPGSWYPKVMALARQQGMDEIDPDEPSEEAKRLGIPRRPSAPPPPTRPAD